jgi:hypothetical protein
MWIRVNYGCDHIRFGKQFRQRQKPRRFPRQGLSGHVPLALLLVACGFTVGLHSDRCIFVVAQCSKRYLKRILRIEVRLI